MKIDHIASGSDGNAIVVGDGHTRILFDAGLPYSKLSTHIKLSTVEGIFITHEHGDHCQAVPELLLRGKDVFMSEGTKKANPEFKYAQAVSAGRAVQVGSWAVMPFDVVHDAKQPFGFLFLSKRTAEKGVYIADTGQVLFEFSGITHWIVECNYTERMIEGNKKIHPAQKRRIRKYHFSVESLGEYLLESDLSKTREIHLIHLSQRNALEDRFVDIIQSKTGIPVYTKNNPKP